MRWKEVAVTEIDLRPGELSLEERHERSRRLLDAVFDEVVTTQKLGTGHAAR
jgi:hypothetical protein